MAREIKIAFDFEVNPHKLAKMFEHKRFNVDVGRGEQENGIPLNTIAVTLRNERTK